MVFVAQTSIVFSWDFLHFLAFTVVVFTTYTLSTNKCESQRTRVGLFLSKHNPEVNTIPTSDGGMTCAHDPNSLYSQIAQRVVYSNLHLSPKLPSFAGKRPYPPVN